MKIQNAVAALAVALLLANTGLLAKTEKTTSASKALIEKTAIIIPKQIADFRLVNFSYDKKFKSSGVSIRYVSSKYPDIPLDFFVYPMGTGPDQEMLKAGMADFTGSLRQAEDMGYFEKLVIRPEQDVILENDKIRVLVPTEKNALPTSANAKPGTDNVVLAAIEKSLELPGKKIDMTHTQKNVGMQSVGYLFYRQLYLTKVRVTIGADVLSGDEFSVMADNAAARIVPQLEARNIGSCSDRKITIKVDESKKQDALSDDFMQQMMAGLSRNVSDNCVTDLALGKISKSEFEVVSIEFTPEDWGN